MSSLIGGLLISGFLTYCYYSNNPDKARQLATNVSWYIVSGYHRVTFWYEDTFKTRVEEEDSDDENIKMNTGEIEKVKFHGYNNGNVIAHDVLENEVKDLVENYDLCFVGKEIDNKLYFQRLEYENDDFSEDEENVKEEKNEEDEKNEEEESENSEEKNEEEESENSEEKNEEEESENSEEKKEESLVPCVRHFLQVECIVGQEKYDIHEHISKYYVTNNLIMDELFMKYFMKQWYDVEMDSSYELKIIDKNISLVTLEKGSKILLGKDEYEIKN